MTEDRCQMLNSLVTICYADNVFYKDHIDPSLIWVATVVNKTWDSLNKTLPPTLETKSRSKRQVQAIANSLLGPAKKGMVKKFLFSLMGPVLKELKSVGQKEAARAVAKHIIPYTGINDHGTGHIVNQLLNQGNVSQAISTLRDNTVEFNPSNMWLEEPLPSTGSIIPHDKMNNHQVFLAARKTLPYIDTMLVDRLKSQSIVDTSLTTALFRGLKKGLNKDLTEAGNKLQEVLVNTIDSMETHQVDRITIYSSCGVILLVSLAGIMIVVRCLCRVHSIVDNIQKNMTPIVENPPNPPIRQPNNDYCTLQQVYLDMHDIERNGTLH